MKVRIVNVPYYDNSAVHQPDATVDIAGPETFSAVCMVPADKEAEKALVAAGRWPLDDAGNAKARGGATTAADLLATAREEAGGIVATAKAEAGDIVAKAQLEAEAIVKKASETKKA